MKTIFVVLATLCFLLPGCGTSTSETDQVTAMRQSLLNAQGCSFEAVITADYMDEVYIFTLSCRADSTQDLNFSVTEPETIAGISGRICDDGAALTFDDQVLAFPALTEGQLSPVIAPWLFLHSLAGGYLTGCAKEDQCLQISIDDSFSENFVHWEIKTNANDIPVWAELFWNDCRILSLEVRDFTLL